MGKMDFMGGTALVTGASSGIGAAVCRALRNSGCMVYGTGCSNMEAIAAEAREPLPSPLYYECADFAFFNYDFHGLVSRASTAMGGVRYLVNAAGLSLAKSTTESDSAFFDRLVAVNLRAPFLLTRECLAAGDSLLSVVNVTSISDRRPRGDMAVYEATKAGLSMLTRSLARELEGVRVNAVAPGIVEVERTADKLRKHSKTISRMIPLGRPAHADEIAKATLFLLSSQLGISGEVLVVDGGLSVQSAQVI